MGPKVAYFSAEFGIDSSLPIYSGGLGILAGDHVKAANDLGLPLVGVGILYRKGYFTQRINSDGTQAAIYPEVNPANLPVTPVLVHGDKPLIISVPMANRIVHLRVWCINVGRVPVYLMDADLDINECPDRRLTDSLYGGDQAMRISQEIILGIGGVRVLRAVGIEPDVWHMNEGHVAFLTMELMREYLTQGVPFYPALEAVKAAAIFTTHTPVPAGHDVFSFELVRFYLADFLVKFGCKAEKLLELGQVGDQFNMTRFAVSTSSRVNGVSKLHAKVTRELFHRWTPEIPAQDIPVDSITNGVHTRSWLAPEMRDLFDCYLGMDWEAQVANLRTWQGIHNIPDNQLWQAHQESKRRMLMSLGISLEVDTLVVGFARRFATYKRALLLFRDLARLEKITNHPQNPVAFIFAGKAHPADRAGQELIRKIVEVSKYPQFRHRIFFVENYDLSIARCLVQGVDVWLNTPLKPLEASGTSGQKAASNGVINCSVLDGWWNEAYNGRNGWAIQGEISGNREEQDQVDGEELYRLLTDEIIPLYYRHQGNFPGEWLKMMKESICSLTPVYSANRMVAEYRDKCYLPTAARGKKFKENGFAIATRVADYKQFIRQNWHQVEVQAVELSGNFAGLVTVRARVRLGPIWFKDVRIQAVGSDGQGGIWYSELQILREAGSGIYWYQGAFSGTTDSWLHSNANVRVLPISTEFVSDFELELARWGQQMWR